MMLLLDYLDDNILIANTHGLFDYSTLSMRMANRYGYQTLRCDVNESRIANIAQNTIDINLPFLQGIANNVINPFKPHTQTTIFNAGVGFTDTTTPDLTDTVTPDITETTTPNTTQTATHTGTVGTEQGAKQFVNAYDMPETGSPTNQSTGNSTSTNDLTDTTTTTGNSTSTRTGTETHTHTGTNELKHVTSGSDETEVTAFNVDEYQKAMGAYICFIDMVIDLLVKDILQIVPRGTVGFI